MTVYSVSSLKNYQSCPFMAATVVQLPRTPHTGPARVGQAGHRVAEAYVHRMMEKPGDITDWEFASGKAKHERALLATTEAEDFDGFIFRFIENFDPRVFSGALAFNTEVLRFAKLWGEPCGQSDANFRYTPDLDWDAADGLHVWDWKTGRIVDQTEHPVRNFQLWAYAFLLAMSKSRRPEVVHMHIYHMRYGRLESHTAKMADLAEHWAETVMGVAEDWRKNDKFQAVLGPQCEDCEVRDRCPDWSAGPARVQIESNSPQDIVAMAGYYAARANHFHDKAVAAVKESGPIDTATHTAEIVPRIRSTFDTNAIVAAMANFPTEDVAKTFTPTKTRLLKMLRKWKMEDRYDELFGKSEKSRIGTDVRISRKRHVDGRGAGSGVEVGDCPDDVDGSGGEE